MKPLILLWSDAWIDVDEARTVAGNHCRLSTDRADLQVADAVVFPVPTLRGELPESRSHDDQLWVLWSQESATQYPQLDNHTFVAQFDLVATYWLDSDLPIPYVVSRSFDALPPLAPLEQRSPTPASAWISSALDKCGRDLYLLELMRYLPIG